LTVFFFDGAAFAVSAFFVPTMAGVFESSTVGLGVATGRCPCCVFTFRCVAAFGLYAG
jgi:hypothetical protein